MHTAALVIGDLGAAEAALDDRADWYGVGGRWTGLIPAQPSATTGKVYGDTLPAFEADVMATFGAGGLSPIRVTQSGPGPGVDQARKYDVDLVAFREMVGQFTMVITGLHVCEAADYYDAAVAATARAMIPAPPLDGMNPDVAMRRFNDYMNAGVDEEAFLAAKLRLIDAAPDDVLLTVVDCHLH